MRSQQDTYLTVLTATFHVTYGQDASVIAGRHLALLLNNTGV
jgi:hypothetical protein